MNNLSNVAITLAILLFYYGLQIGQKWVILEED